MFTTYDLMITCKVYESVRIVLQTLNAAESYRAKALPFVCCRTAGEEN